jgi:hypothetical protein
MVRINLDGNIKNVHADKHATSGLAQVSDPAQMISMIPSSKVTFRIHNTDITSHYATHLRKAATRPAMLRRAPKHYGWVPAQFEMIDWKAHHGALRKLQFNEKKFVTKCIHQSLLFVVLDNPIINNTYIELVLTTQKTILF